MLPVVHFQQIRYTHQTQPIKTPFAIFLITNEEFKENKDLK